VLNLRRSYGTFKKADTTREHLLQMMAGGEELEALAVELDLIAKKDPTSAAQMEHQAAENLHQR
jgi:simple sugar transport system ATP-binding protein